MYDSRPRQKDWAIIEQSVAVLQLSAQATKLLEGTKYVTISLTLPYMYRLIEASADNMLYMPWKPAGQQWLRATQLEPECARRSSCWYQPVYAGQCLGW